jgi:hypothetical protein
MFSSTKTQGRFDSDWPFYWPLHEIPYDFYRFSKYGFENLLKKAGFQEIAIIANGGTWAQIFYLLPCKFLVGFFH